MSGGFGARLRSQRERQRIELRSIADQTKIKLSLLEGLERDDVSHWPGGIFRRAFVRAYAQAIGLDPDAIVREFLEVYPDPGEIIATAFHGANNEEPTGPFARLRAAFGAGRPSPRDREPPPSGLLDLRTASTPTLESRPGPEPIKEPAPTEPHLEERASGDGLQPAADPNLATDMPGTACPPDSPPESAMIDEIDPSSDGAFNLEPDLAALADVCTALGRVGEPDELTRLMPQVARALDATGLIVWLWDPAASALRPTLAHGYSAHVLAQLPAVEKDADNATAAAFRLERACSVSGTGSGSGAIAVPMMAPHGCGGVLAVELRQGSENRDAVRAAATIVAAQLAAMIRPATAAASAGRKLA